MPGPLNERGALFEHGTVTVGVTAVVAQAADLTLREWTGYNAGPGNIYPGTSAVSSANSIPAAVGDYLFSSCADNIYLVADQANTVVKFIRERVEI